MAYTSSTGSGDLHEAACWSSSFGLLSGLSLSSRAADPPNRRLDSAMISPATAGPEYATHRGETLVIPFQPDHLHDKPHTRLHNQKPNSTAIATATATILKREFVASQQPMPAISRLRSTSNYVTPHQNLLTPTRGSLRFLNSDYSALSCLSNVAHIQGYQNNKIGLTLSL